MGAGQEKSGVQTHTADFVFRLFLFPVVPDVLHIVVIFHDVDELACLYIQENVENWEKTELLTDILSASVSMILPMSVTVDLGINIITQNVK